VDVPCEDTLSDATAGGVEPGAITLGLCQQVVDRSELVTEAEIADAMRAVFQALDIGIEGAAGVAMAVYLRERAQTAGQTCAVIICGGNISPTDLGQVLHGANSTESGSG
jgi:threonine dehydratase